MNNNVRVFEVDGIKILGNFNNGAIIGLDEAAYNYIYNDAEYDEQSKIELENALKDLGFYDDVKTNDMFATYLHVNDRCNLHCIGCYSYIDDRNNQKELSTEELCYVLDNLKTMNLQNLVISGGEPFLRDDISEILRYAKVVCRIPNVATITNGTLDINRYKSSLKYIDVFNISVDGYDNEVSYLRDEGIFPKIEKLLSQLPKSLNVNLISTLHKKNAPFMEKYGELAKKHNVTYSFSIFTVEEKNLLFKDFVLDSKDLIDINNRLMKINSQAVIEDTPIGSCCLNCRTKCEAGDKMLSIDSKGNIYPCHMLHYDELKMGNVFDEEITAIVDSHNNKFKNLSVDEFEDCSICKYKYLCGGGCRGRSYLKTGSFKDKDSYCVLNYNFYRDTLKHLKS